jgi:hypothetical protein
MTNYVDEVVIEVLVRLLDDRGGPLLLQGGGVIERATGRGLTTSEVAYAVEQAINELAALEEDMRMSDD